MNSDLSESEIQTIIDEEVQKLQDEADSKLYPNWQPGERKRPLVSSFRLEDFEEEASNAPKWTLRDKRCGALAIKVGMMPVWDKWGERHPCTILYLDNNVVIRNMTQDVDGYTAVQVGAGERKEKRVAKPQIGMYHKYGIHEKYPFIVREFRVTTEEALPPPGSRIHARHFNPGQNVDISGISKGKGFQGGMKRHGFKGMPASHGTSKSHRAIGSTGMCQDPGRVFKGKKMPGRMGGVRVTKQNLRIVKIDRGRDLIYVRGAVPGNKGSFVEIRDAVKRPLFGTEKCEGGNESAFPPLPTFAYEEGVDGSGEAGFDVMMPMQEQDPLEIVEDDAA
jgi:large subunit ribosomal protein L3